MRRTSLLLLSTLLVAVRSQNVLNILSYGAISNSSSGAAATANAAAITKALGAAKPGDTVLIPASHAFHATGGIGVGLPPLVDVTLQIDGDVLAHPNEKLWPKKAANATTDDDDGYDVELARKQGQYHGFFELSGCRGLLITSSRPGGALVDGQGRTWWAAMILGTLKAKRPKLFVISNCTGLTIESINARNSPSFHWLLSNVAHAEVRYLNVDVDNTEVRRLKAILRARRLAAMPARARLRAFPDPALQPEDLNTDGIDPSGTDVWVHHVNIRCATAHHTRISWL